MRNETGLSERAVKYAVKDLVSKEIISEFNVVSDMRKKLYGLANSRIAFGEPKNKIAGVVGGLGPQTTAEFYLRLTQRLRESRKFSPKMVIDNVSYPVEIEEKIISGGKREELQKLLEYLKESVMRLNRAGVDVIAIPCNTAHVFIEELRKESKARILSIVEETVAELMRMGVRKVGILATTATTKSGMYQDALKNGGISCIAPNKRAQIRVSKAILRFLGGNSCKEAEFYLKAIAKNMTADGAEIILLACTDIGRLLDADKIAVATADTFEILINKTAQEMEG